VLDCGSGLTECGNSCVDLRSDASHCGACGKACAGTDACCGGTCASWHHLTSFGDAGADGFDFPCGVAVSADGRTAWVADTLNTRVTVWTASGDAWARETAFGSGPGDAPDQFLYPLALAISADGQTVWVTDVGNGRVSVWTKSGEAWENQTTFGNGSGSDTDQFRLSLGIAVGAEEERVWVADTGNDRISIWAKTEDGWANEITFGGFGFGDGQFRYSSGVALSADEKSAWVSDGDNSRISVWTESGGSWSYQSAFGSFGRATDRDGLYTPQAVSVSPDGRTVWVADSDNHRVSVWGRSDDGWIHQTNFGSGPGSGADQLDSPQALAVSADGQTVWVADSQNNRISVWRKGCPPT
jgi:DNA-binding beta-propeller fold protein YncE